MDYITKTFERLKEEAFTYYLDEDYDEYEKNEIIILNKKMKNLFMYPPTLKNIYNKKDEISLSDLSDRLLECIYEDSDCRTVNPVLLLLCYSKIKDKINYEYFEDQKTFMIKGKSKKIREQIMYSFAIYWKLISDENIRKFKNHFENEENEVMVEMINSLYYGITVEEQVLLNNDYSEKCENRYNDMCLSLHFERTQGYPRKENVDKMFRIFDEQKKYFFDKIIIEINEDHHKPDKDEERNITIHSKTRKVPLQFDTSPGNIREFYNVILTQISKHIYQNIDSHNGLIFQLTSVEKIELGEAKQLLDIFDKTTSGNGYNLGELMNMLKRGGFEDVESFFKREDVIEELNDEEYFTIKKKKLKNSYLTGPGVDRVLTLPWKKDFPNISSFIKMITKFREGYFLSIIKLLETNDNEKYDTLRDNLATEYIDSIESGFNVISNIVYERLINSEIKNKFEKKFKVTISESLPIIINTENKYDKISSKLLLRSLNDELRKIFVAKFNVSKSYIYGYKFLSSDMIKWIMSQKAPSA